MLIVVLRIFRFVLLFHHDDVVQALQYCEPSYRMYTKEASRLQYCIVQYLFVVHIL